MNTHIIIPIKNIEDQIEKLTKKKKCDNDYEQGVNYGKIDILEDLLIEYKQISFDEKDIEDAAEAYTSMYLSEDKNETDSINRKHAYKQALKDLL